jgi:hypothetical protein
MPPVILLALMMGKGLYMSLALNELMNELMVWQGDTLLSK